MDTPSIVDVLKVLADESRIRILALLATREASVEEIAASLRLRPPTVAHHLSRLKALGLTRMRREGTTHRYRFERERLRAFNRRLEPEQLVDLVPTAPGDDSFSAKVLRDFFEAEALKTIPASRRKRLVVLKWLAARFAPRVRYPERAINDVLRRHHPDFATLRRELVINRLMVREAGVYWRSEPTADAGSRATVSAVGDVPRSGLAAAWASPFVGRTTPLRALAPAS